MIGVLSLLHAFFSQAFVAAMKNIHRAGIKHMDIRTDNLVIHPETGKVAIIDFDRAEFPLEKLKLGLLLWRDGMLKGSPQRKVYA